MYACALNTAYPFLQIIHDLSTACQIGDNMVYPYDA